MQDTTISGTYETLGEKGLKKAIKEIDKILFDHKMKEHLNIFNNLKADGHSSDELIKIISAAIDGRIESLYLQDGKTLPGEIDTQSKKIINDPSNVLNVNDIFDDLAQLTLSKGGKVYILDSESMTTTTGVAATFRY